MIVTEAVKDFEADVAYALVAALKKKEMPLPRAQKLARMALEAVDELMTGEVFLLRLEQLAQKDPFFKAVVTQHKKRYAA